MDSAGSEAKNHISLSDGRPVKQPRLFHDSHTEPGQVIVFILIDVRHDGCFTADQSCVALDTSSTDALDNLLQQSRIVLSHGHIVEKKEWLGAAANGIVDAHRHQVDADRVMSPCELGHFDFRSHPIRTRNQDGIFVRPRK